MESCNVTILLHTHINISYKSIGAIDDHDEFVVAITYFSQA